MNKMWSCVEEEEKKQVLFESTKKQLCLVFVLGHFEFFLKMFGFVCLDVSR